MSGKVYQRELSDAFAAYLASCRELDDPATVCRESTRDHFDHASTEHPLPLRLGGEPGLAHRRGCRGMMQYQVQP